MSEIENALKLTTDTKACEIGPGAVESAAHMFGQLFGGAKALIVADPRTWKVAGERVRTLLSASGVDCATYLLGADGKPFHAEYRWIDELRGAAAAAGDRVPVAVGSGTVNDIVKRTSEELGRRYMVVGTAASMDGYTSFGAAITKDGMKQTLSCKAPLGCIVDSRIAADAPGEMTASGYADLIAKIPAGADWMLADAIGSERIHPEAWRFVQGALRDSISNPAGCAAKDEREVRKLCEGLVMSGFAMQAMGSSRPASGTEHQVSHYWDMEDLCFGGKPVSHGFKVGIGTLISTKTLEFLLRQDLASLDVDAVVAKWPQSFDDVKRTFPAIFGNRPDHVKRAEMEYAKKFPSRDELTAELSTLRDAWPSLSRRIAEQLMPFDEVREKLKAVGAPYEPEMIGISRRRFHETYLGVPYMRSRYFGLDLVERIGLKDALVSELFGAGGVWAIDEISEAQAD